MNDSSLEVAKAVEQAAGDLPVPIAVFVATLLGRKLLAPSLEVAGEALADHVRRMQFRSQVKGLSKTLTLLEKEGIPLTAVDPKFLAPWFTGVGLEAEDDEQMIDRWAALLVNASAGTAGAGVLPSFPKILAELSPEEAVILDTLYRDADPAQVPSLYHRYADDPELRGDHDPLFYTRCFNLARLGLLEASWENVQIRDSDPPEYKHTVARLEGNALGLSFVIACTPPGGTRSRANV